MISFVWSSRYPFLAGAGGSESYTAGHIRELTRRGIPARIISIGHGENDGREDWPGIDFLAIKDQKELKELDDTLVFVTYPLNVKPKHASYAILHCPPPKFARNDDQYDIKAFKNHKLITASKFSAGLWRRQLHAHTQHMPTVYPFASPVFSQVSRPKKPKGSKTRVLFASRLTPDKGIYTLMSSLHMDALKGVDYSLTVTDSGAHTDEGKIIHKLVKAHPGIRVVRSRKNPQEMAKLMAKYDVVVMPSTDIYWQELFGMVSVEAQHAGCRVVASKSGGLPETNAGGVLLVKPDDPNALAKAMAKAIKLGPLTAKERAKATKQFTLEKSVDGLLKAIRYSEQDQPNTRPLREAPGLLPRLFPLLDLRSGRSKASKYASTPGRGKYARAVQN